MPAAAGKGQGRVALLTPGLQASSLQNCESISPTVFPAYPPRLPTLVKKKKKKNPIVVSQFVLLAVAARGDKCSFAACGRGILPASPRAFPPAAAWGWAPGCTNGSQSLRAPPLSFSGGRVECPPRAEKDPNDTILASPYQAGEATTMQGNRNLRTKPSGSVPEQRMTSACRRSPSRALPTAASGTRARGRGRLEPEG